MGNHGYQKGTDREGKEGRCNNRKGVIGELDEIAALFIEIAEALPEAESFGGIALVTKSAVISYSVGLEETRNGEFCETCKTGVDGSRFRLDFVGIIIVQVE